MTGSELAFGEDGLNKPADVVVDPIWFGEDKPDGTMVRWAEPNPDGHAEDCRVYWGSHGCARPRGHDGPHWCDCCTCVTDKHPHGEREDGTAYNCVAGPPYYGPETEFFGEDA